MGLTRTRIKLSNPSRPSVHALEVEALVDTGATYLCIPAQVASELEVHTEAVRRAVLADGGREDCPYVGPVRVQFENRPCLIGALVMGDEVLLRAMPLQDMDLIATRLTHTRAVNPDNPEIGIALAKSSRVENAHE